MSKIFRSLSKSSSGLFSSNPFHRNDRHSHSTSSLSEANCREEIDGRAALEAFKSHWAQAWTIMQTKCVPSIDPITVDDITSVVNHIDHMVTLLVQESQGIMSHLNQEVSSGCSPMMMSPLLDYMLMESILDKLLSWSLHSGEWSHILQLEQLKLYELLVSQLCHREALFQKPLIRPLLSLLAQCVNRVCHLEVEKRLVVLLNTLCVCLSQNINLLELFFDKNASQNENKFLVFSLLIPFVHREGAIGQQARDALLLCMAISRTNESVAKYIAEESNFCPVLATGLSGLYSALPRKLSDEALLADDWHQLTTEDILEMPELESFLNSLEFCNAVIQISHPLIQQQLLDFIYNGFLVLVIGPALHQDVADVPLNHLEKLPKYSNTLEEIIATTAYLELFIRTISEPILLRVFLKFICTEKFEDQKILDTLILRIHSHSKLCLINLVLFHTLLDLNCEDVILELVLKYLITCKHLTGSEEQKRKRIKDMSCYNVSAQKFLTQIPLRCIFQTTTEMKSSCEDESFEFIEHFDGISQISNGSETTEIKMILSNYLDYLSDAHQVITNCVRATNSWNNNYNSIEMSEQRSANNNDVPICNGTEDHSPIGPFLEAVFSRFEGMCENDIYTNLHLTGLISRLACYPQPLIRSFLLSSKMSFRNDVKSLWYILSELKNKLDAAAGQISNFDVLMRQARRFLSSRERLLNEKGNFSNEQNGRRGSINSISPSISEELNKPRKRRSIKDFLFRKMRPVQPTVLESVPGGHGYRYINNGPRTTELAVEASEFEETDKTQKIVLAMLVFEEFLKEVSAISYEHYISENLDLFISNNN